MRTSPRHLRVLIFILAGAVSARAFADGLVRDGVGPIATGRGATNLGFADNAAMIMDNPAAMTNVMGCGITEFGVDTAICGLHYQDPDNDVDSITRGWPGPNIGYVRRVPDSPWAYGIGVFAPAGFGAEYNMQHPIFGAAKYESLGLLAKVLPAIAYQWSDRLSVGASLGLAMGHNELEGPFFIQTGPFAGAPTLLDLQATGVAVTGGLGLQYILTEQTTIGVAYTEQTQLDLDGNAAATIFTPFGPLDSTFDAEARLVWPRSFGVGLKHELCCCRRLGIDVIWFNWAKAFDTLDLTFSNPSNPIIGALLGPSFSDSLPLRWENTVSFRFGYEWDYSDCLTWRLGYVYHDSPVPAATLNPYLDGVLMHTFSVGMSYGLSRGVVNASYQFMYGPERDVADSAIIGDDFDNSTFSAQAHWINLSWMIPF